MMNRWSTNIFKYNNTRYSIFISLYTGYSGRYENNMSLDINDLDEFVYDNDLNQLIISGHIIYTDKYGIIDKILQQHFTYCQVSFYENSLKNDGDIGIEKLDENRKFIHTFIVTGMKILSRNGSIIQYYIDLVSTNWLNCSSNIEFSNYGKEKQSILDIFKECILKNKLKINADSFDKVKTEVKINFISNINDNLFTVTKYLMDRMYYFDIQDSTVKFFIYNETNDNIQLFNLVDKDTSTGIYTTTLSFFKLNHECLIQQEPTKLGNIAYDIQKTDVYQNFFDHTLFDYSYDSNNFRTRTVTEKMLLNYANARITNDSYGNRYEALQSPALIHKFEQSFWNNDETIYTDILRTLNENNTIMLNITGDILRKPGSILNIALDRSIKNITDENKQEFEQNKVKYKSYEGAWFTSRVQHIIRPNEPSYRQNIVIFRNYIKK